MDPLLTFRSPRIAGWLSLRRAARNIALGFVVLLGPGWLMPESAAAQPSAAAADESPSAAAPAAESQPGFFGILFSGGVPGVLIMLALLGLSLTATYLVIEQALTLRARELMPAGLSDQIRDFTAAGRLAEADRACRGQPSVLAFVLLNGLAEVDGGWPAVEKAMEDATAEQSARLYRKVEYLSVIGNLAPMLGLLGTVTGMILAFRQVASTQGAAGAADLAEGIYSALVTTVAGLVIAIPSLGAFAVLRNRLDQLIAEAAYLAQHALGPLKRYRGGAGTGSSPLPPAPPPVPGGRQP
jgi:biopolymer transport protein ExbB